MQETLFAPIAQFFIEFWNTLIELSPSLLLGLLIAGLLHVFLPANLIHRQMKGKKFSSVFKAVLIGVPMPLCSCGVVPTTLGLRRDGASRGAATGFLISTPQTGVDSVLVSASFLGWPFALFKVGAAFFTGLIGGQLVNLTEPSESASEDQRQEIGDSNDKPTHGRLKEIFNYAIFDILASIDIWILLGLVISAVITVAVPTGMLAGYSWVQGVGGMLVVLAIAMPLYVCATGSVPVAASLIAAGMPLGSALVFLMAGPATNAATIGAIYKALGLRVVSIYVAVVAVFSVALGMLFNWILLPMTSTMTPVHTHGTDWLGISSAVVVGALLAMLVAGRLVRKMKGFTIKDQRGNDMDNIIQVSGMTCGHCVANVKIAVESVAGITEAAPDLQTGRVELNGDDFNIEDVLAAVNAAGYKATI